jgi:hypothetical protein
MGVDGQSINAFPDLNINQLEAIEHTDGPLLIIAGPWINEPMS